MNQHYCITNINSNQLILKLIFANYLSKGDQSQRVLCTAGDVLSVLGGEGGQHTLAVLLARIEQARTACHLVNNT